MYIKFAPTPTKNKIVPYYHAYWTLVNKMYVYLWWVGWGPSEASTPSPVMFSEWSLKP